MKFSLKKSLALALIFCMGGVAQRASAISRGGAAGLGVLGGFALGSAIESSRNDRRYYNDRYDNDDESYNDGYEAGLRAARDRR